MDVDSYLARIGLSGPVEPDLPNLERLQRAHLSSVPFENLDVYAGRGVKTTDDWTVPKIVERGRGGWCFELNGAFAALLSSLGYEVRRLAATVLMADVSPMPTHLTLEVTLDRPYLVDVGFGDSFIRPLLLDISEPQDGGSGSFGFVFEDEMTTLVEYLEEPTPQYRFERRARSAADFEEASVYLRTQPGLRWTQTRFATRLLEDGPDRVTLLEDRIKFRRDGVWSESPTNESKFPRLLEQWFGMQP